ncbi:hypothetical protein [Delftia sp. RIT313]|uniref:hypothetical protein n=1 Tax=Delftia sp. RIT313 TaxID=1468410 RepID=UPI000450C9CB|nr:hypothetical protein [Delftia sp. RIT313]EZP51406.1 hypothetical protein BW39_03875 [Delftia sp. RIT313]
MTPRQEIQEHARTAAQLVHEALKTFHAKTGMKASVYVDWGSSQTISEKEPTWHLSKVVIDIDDEAGVYP